MNTRNPIPPVVRPLGPEEPAFLFALLDLFSLLMAFLAVYAVAPGLKRWLLSSQVVSPAWLSLLSPETRGEFGPITELLWVLLVMAVVTLLGVQLLGGNRSLVAQSRTRIVVTTIVAPVVGLSTITLILFTLKTPNWSRLFIFLFAATSGVALCTYRLFLRSYRRRRIASGVYAKSVILMGPTSAMAWLSDHMARNTSPAEYNVVGYLIVPQAHGAGSGLAKGDRLDLPCLGDAGQLDSLLVHRLVHEVIAVQDGASPWLKDVVEVCDYFRITLRIVSKDLLLGPLRDLELLYRFDPLRLPEIVLRSRHMDSTALFFKRVIDVVVSSVMLVFLSPVFLLIAAAIKLTTPRLPVFYRWEVVGFNGRRFTGYKFTTMDADADSRKAELMSHNEMQGPVFKMQNDPRVTSLGRFLRKFSLNELPQLWSVLKGDMSLVGPRPAFPAELELYETWQKRKLCVRPGITCLWQISGRNKIAKFDDWVKLDFEYIDNWSLWLDFVILVRTAWVVIAGTGS